MLLEINGNKNMIYIFGDSHAYPGEYDWNCFSHKGWYEYFNEEIENYAHPGTGPQYSFKKFDEVLKKLTNKDKVIFVLSYPSRFDFDSPKPGHSNDISEYVVNNKELYDTSCKEYVDENYECIKYLFKIMANEISLINLKNILYLKHISYVTKVKFFVMTVNKILHIIEYINDDNFFLLNDLFNISAKEIMNYNIETSFNLNFRDRRKNHLSRKNNENLFHIINYFFKGNKKMMIEKLNSFEINAFEFDEICESTKFIYD